MPNLLFATLGSLGDVRPLLCIAILATQRGHNVTFATSDSFRPIVEAHGIRYVAFGSDGYFEDCDTRASLVEPRTGFAQFMALSNLRDIEALFGRLDELAKDADGIVSTPLVMPAHLVAQRRKLPLISCALSPAMLRANWGATTFDPYAGEWRRCLNKLRLSAGLPRRTFPQMERYSADLMLGVYPKCLTSTGESFIRAPCEVGYPFLEEFGNEEDGEHDELLEWMGDRQCVLVSFGSFVDEGAVRIFDCATKACAALGYRLLFVSKYRADELAHLEGADVRVEHYVPHRVAMRRSALVVHHCGVGTLAAAAAAGRPMVAVPFGLDQIYNAEVIRRRDLAETLPSHSVTYEHFCNALIDALDRWPERERRWRSWLDDGGDTSAQRVIELVEAVLPSYL